MTSPNIGQKLMLVLLGGPGAGKGTQAQRLRSGMGLLHLSSGDLFRQIGSRSDQLSQLIHGRMSAGDLVPDELTTQLITAEIERLCTDGPGVVIDGFPRTRVQAQLFDEWLGQVGAKIAVVIHLKVDHDVKVQRSMLRGRDDDRPDIINHRLAVYDAATRPVFDHYLGQGIIVDVDGDRPEEAVAAEIASLIGARSHIQEPVSTSATGMGSRVRGR